MNNFVSNDIDSSSACSHVPGFLWTPVRAKPRREKKIAEFCEANNITCYLPLIRRIHRYGRRTVESFVPMFSGYIFCLLNEEKHQRLLRSNAVVYRIMMDEISERVLLNEFDSIRAFEELSRRTEVVVKPELAEGSRISVNSGPLAGTHGIVTRRKGKTMLAVNIEILGQSVAAELDAGDLDLCKD